MDNYLAKIGLGSVQWGLNYGVSNQYGLTPADEVCKILEFSKSCGLSIIDTAPAYGNSEKVIGANDITAFNLCTKVPALKSLDLSSKIESLFQSSIDDSLQNLRTRSVEYLLVHDCDDLLGEHGTQVSLLMQNIKNWISKKNSFFMYTFLKFIRLSM